MGKMREVDIEDEFIADGGETLLPDYDELLDAEEVNAWEAAFWRGEGSA